MKRTPRATALYSLTLLTLPMALLGQGKPDTLLQGFLNPPASAKPRVWWHWMNGNITKEGIQRDLEWMQRVGIGGFQNFDANLVTPKLVEKRLVYMTPEWRDAFLYATTLADKLGLEMAIAGSPGWSESGGPWVKPEQAMKKIAWSETVIKGGRPFSGKLPQPPDTIGGFQNLPESGFKLVETKPIAPFYRDSTVFAYRVPEVEANAPRPKITTSAGKIDHALLSDGDLATSASLPAAPKGQKAWIQFEYPTPQTIYAIFDVSGGAPSPFQQFLAEGDSGQELQASEDGVHFRTLLRIPGGASVPHTMAFPPATARYFRVTFVPIPPPPSPFGDTEIPGLGRAEQNSTEFKIAELVLYSSPRVNRFEDKAAFRAKRTLLDDATPPVPAQVVVQPRDVIDVSRFMQSDGTLQWTPPTGTWRIVRMGYSLTGHKNGPATAEATGLEVDKLSPKHVKTYFETYLGYYKETVGELMGKRGIQYLLTDSWEAGTQNWTEEMFSEFKRRRGYDMHTWLPALTGCVVESAEATDRFLWDFRQTLSDMVVDYHYDQLTTLLKKYGMGRYSESHEDGRAFIGDGMEVKRTATIPMGAMWVQRPGVNAEQTRFNADLRESASVAHIYGQNLVAGESFTAGSGSSAWGWSPETIKPTADKEMAMGLNRFVIHTSVHQPFTDRVPGLALGPIGQWFNRNETWAELASPWITYLSRCSYLLQQGQIVADILYYYGQDSNVTALFGEKPPTLPHGYNFDYVNADALLHRIEVQGGSLTTRTGMRYRVLVLDPHSKQMTLPVLRKIRDLVQAGAVVVGERPSHSPSLQDDHAEFEQIAASLWSSTSTGEGKIYAGASVQEVLQRLGVRPDVDSPSTVLSVHRKTRDADIYFINNAQDAPLNTEIRLRVQGKTPEIWHPDTGKREPVAYTLEGGTTRVTLSLNPRDTVFIVLRTPTKVRQFALPQVSENTLLTLDDDWKVSFQPNRGAPESISLPYLLSWSQHEDKGVKYFSGTALYTKSFALPQGVQKAGSRLWLDLGDVKNLAEVTLNGKNLGILWRKPFRVDITEAVKSGSNQLTIGVTNLWVNRLIGDQQPNTKTRYTYTPLPPYQAKSPLLPSGLLGGVKIGESH